MYNLRIEEIMSHSEQHEESSRRKSLNIFDKFSVNRHTQSVLHKKNGKIGNELLKRKCDFRFNAPALHGFTLAEVLVTLAVIGVISAMVIPSLQKSFQESQYRAGAKKAYSMLGQAILMMKADNDLPAFAGDNSEFTTKFCNHLSCIKTDQAKNIFTSTYNYYENGSAGYDYSWVAAPSVILKNGMLAFFVYDAANCTGNAGTLFTTVCADIYVDTNGKKGPNMFGKDYVRFWLVRERGTYVVYPNGISRGVTNDWQSCTPNAPDISHSVGCTAYYIENKDLP